MIRTLLKEVKEYKAASLATPIFMILEVLFETLIPWVFLPEWQEDVMEQRLLQASQRI